MKKFLAFGATLLLGLGAFGVANNVKMADATGINPTDAENLFNSFIDENGYYTKKTTLYLTEAARGETSYFHNGANAAQRATYYSENTGALLMGDYDGSFTNINSGYKNDGNGNAKHFTYLGTGDDTSDLFTNVEYGWTAQAQEVGNYYPTLTSLKKFFTIGGSAWSYDGAYDSFVYSPTLGITDGHYNDIILKNFQFFIAPMMLEGNYFSWSSVRVTKASNFLSLRLMASASDEEKSTIKGATEVLVAEARVFKGLDFNSNPVPATLKGSFDSWGAGYTMSEITDIYVPEQYKYTLSVVEGTPVELKVNHIYGGNDHWTGYNDSNKDDYYVAGSDNIQLSLAGTYTVYFKVLGDGHRSIYISRDSGLDKEYTFNDVPDWVISSNASIFAWIWGGQYGGGSWMKLSDLSVGAVSFKVTFDYSAGHILFVRCPSNTETPNWSTAGDAAGRIWNKTNDIDFTSGVYTYSTNWVDHNP